MNKYAILLFAFSFIFSSCAKNNSYKGAPVNSDGGVGRTNNFEELGSFNSDNNIYEDSLNCPDQSGALIPPLVMDYSRAAMVSSKGTVIVTKSKNDTAWTAKLNDGHNAIAPMCADKDQNLYIISDKGTIFSYSENGKLRWKYQLECKIDNITLFTGLLATGKGIAVASNKGYIAQVSTDGKLQWSRKHNMNFVEKISADSEGNILIALTNNEYGKSDTLLFIDPQGKAIWSLGFDKTRLLTYPVIGKKYIYAAGAKAEDDTKKSKIFYITKEGKVEKEVDIDYAPNSYPVAPKYLSVANNNNLFLIAHHYGIGNQFNYVFCYNEEGEKLWLTSFDLMILSPIMIGEDELAFVGSQEGKVGVLYIHRDGKGTFLRVIDIQKAYKYNLIPAIAPDPAIYFAGSDHAGILRIDRSAIDKVLPW